MRSSLPIVKLARISSVFGKNGELTIRLYDAFCEEPNFEEPFFVMIDGLEVPLFLKSFSRRGNQKAVVVFEDIDNEFRASELLSMELYTYAQEEDDDDNFYYEELVGYSFFCQNSSSKGVVTDFIDNPYNPILVVSTLEGVEILLPINREHIVGAIDTDARSIELNIPDDIFELYTTSDN